MPFSNGEALLTITEVAKALRVDATTVRRWINQGVLDAVALPHLAKRRVYRVPQSSLERVLHSQTSSKAI